MHGVKDSFDGFHVKEGWAWPSPYRDVLFKHRWSGFNHQVPSRRLRFFSEIGNDSRNCGNCWRLGFFRLQEEIDDSGSEVAEESRLNSVLR